MIAVETTIQLHDIITWVVILAGFVSTAVWMKLTVVRHESVIYNKQGEVRLVSFEALDRIRENCLVQLKAEKQQDVTNISSLLTKMEEVQKELRQLSKCVTILAAGGKAEDC